MTTAVDAEGDAEEERGPMTLDFLLSELSVLTEVSLCRAEVTDVMVITLVDGGFPAQVFNRMNFYIK